MTRDSIFSALKVMQLLRSLAVLLGLLLAFTGDVTAQAQDIGVQFNAMRLDKIDEAPFLEDPSDSSHLQLPRLE